MCEFLATQRARITPVQAGLPVYRGVRRVVGPNRDEVAMPAGVSSEYHARPREETYAVCPIPFSMLLPVHCSWTRPNAHLFDLARPLPHPPGQLLLDVPAGMSVPGNDASWTA